MKPMKGADLRQSELEKSGIIDTEQQCAEHVSNVVVACNKAFSIALPESALQMRKALLTTHMTCPL